MVLRISTFSRDIWQQKNKKTKKSTNNKAPFPTSIIFPFYSLSPFIFFCLFLLPPLCCAYNGGKIKSCYSNKQGKNKKRKLCHPYREGGILTFFSRTEREEEMEGGKETEKWAGIESVYQPISRLLFEPEGMWDV